MTRCPNCRTKVDDTFTSHCPECGTSVMAGVESMPVAQPVLADERSDEDTRPDPVSPPPAAPPRPAQAPYRGGRRFATGVGVRVVLAVLVFGGINIYRAFTEADRDDLGAVVDDGTINAFDLQVGDCIQLPDPDSDEFDSVEAVPCSSAHDAEVYALLSHPAGDGTPWPGSEAISNWSLDACYEAFAGYVGRTYEEATELNYRFFTPTEYGWGKQDDRIVQCLIIRVDGEQLVGGVATA